MDTIKDHLKSKKHRQRKDLKEADTSSSGRKQVTLTTLVKSKDLREEFVLDFIKMSTMVDIPLEKVERIRPFLLKYCKQAGTLPKASTLRSQYIPRAFEGHFIALKDILKESAPALVHLTADETTDVRDQSILNIVPYWNCQIGGLQSLDIQPSNNEVCCWGWHTVWADTCFRYR